MVLLAKVYAALLGVLALWAWYTDVTLLHSPLEHLLPDILLAFASLPTSLTTVLFFMVWPTFFTGLVQLAWLTFCAAIQATLFFIFARAISKRAATSPRIDA